MCADVVKNEVKLDNVREVIRMAEAYIDGTVKLSLASDSRAMQLSGISATASSAFLLFGLNQLSGTSSYKVEFAVAAFAASLMFCFVLVFTLTAARPRPFDVVGTTPDRWSQDELRGDLALALLGQANVYQAQIKSNLAALSRNAKRIRCALFLLGATPVVSALAAIATHYLR